MERAAGTSTDLRSRTRAFSLRVLKLIEAMPHTRSAGIIANQLGRSGTAVGANYRAARRSRSRREFIAKLGIVEEEADECCFWLEMIIDANILPEPHIRPLLSEANEIVAMVVASIVTARNNKP